MKTLFIYDNKGKIIDFKTGTNFYEPDGIPFLIEEIPENAYPIKVNVQGEKHYVEYGFNEISELEKTLNKLKENEMALIDLAELIFNLTYGGNNNG